MADTQPSRGIDSTPIVLPAAGDSLLTSVPVVDEILSGHASDLGHEFSAYLNHVYRVVNLCTAIAGNRGDLEKIAIAAAFHDLGIWTSKTFDYIPPSMALAREYLASRGQMDWIGEIERMISDHHKITSSTTSSGSLVEAFRRADWIDVTRGLRTFGIPRPFIKAVFARWPNSGFHWGLVKLTLERLRTHPLTPLPMFKL